MTVNAEWKENAAPETNVSGILLAKMRAKGKASLCISWTRMEGAEGYDIYFAKYGRKVSWKVKTIEGNRTFKWKKKKLKAKRAYKAVVKAYVMKNGEKIYVGTSPTVHAYTSGGTKSYTNPRRVKVRKRLVSLRAGRTYKIRARVIKLKKGRKLMPSSYVAYLRYISSDTKVAAVSKTGRI